MASLNMSLCMHKARLANVMARLSESGVEYRTDLLYDLRLRKRTDILLSIRRSAPKIGCKGPHGCFPQ